MAEIIGTAASIASFIGLAGQVVIGATNLYKFFTDIRDGPEDIQDLTNEIKAVESISQNIFLLSRNVKTFTEEQSIMPMLLEAKKRIDRLSKIPEEFSPKHDSSKTVVLLKNIQYAFKREVVQKHLRNVYRIKSLLTNVQLNINSALQLDIRTLASTTVDSVKTLHENQNMSLTILHGIQRVVEQINLATVQPQNELLEINQRVTENGSYTPWITTRRLELPAANSTYPSHVELNAGNKHPLEEFAENQFQLLVVCIFLNKTKGEAAIPKARALFQRYPTPEVLAIANSDEIKPYFKGLGLSTRAQRLIELAKTWLELPPEINKRRGKRGQKSNDISEVSHLPGIGRFASDCWRVFCKEQFYRSAGHDLPEAEWKRVVPSDLKLIDYLKLRWEKEGFIWNPTDGSLRKQLLESKDLEINMNNLRIQ